MQIPTKGSLAETNFFEILKDSASSSLTGMVRVESGQTIKVVYLQQGNIAFASSNDKNDRLTEVLKRAGKLTPEQIEHAQQRLKPNVSLGKTLVELGYISAKDLLWGARTQVESILHQLLFWDHGSYQIMEGPLPKEIVSLNIPAQQIIYDGVLKTQDRNWVLQHIVSPQSVYALSQEYHHANTSYKFPVEAIVSRMNGKRTLEEIAQAAGADTFEVCKAVAALQILNLAQRQPDKPIQIPLLVAQEEAKEEEAEGMGMSPSLSAPTVSLGQMMQIPTVAELQQEEEMVEEVQTPSIDERVEEEEPLPEPAPTQMRVEKQEEEEQVGTVTIPKPQPLPPAPEPPADEPIFAFPDTATSREVREPQVPLEGMTLTAKKQKYPHGMDINWRALAMIMVIVAALAVGGLLFYNMYWQPRMLVNDTQPIPTPAKKTPQPPKPQGKEVTEPMVLTDSESGEPAEKTGQQKPANDLASKTKEPAVPPKPTTKNTATKTTEPAVQPKPTTQNTATKTTEPAVQPKPAQKTTEPAKTVETPKALTPREMLAKGQLDAAALAWKKELQQQRSKFTIQLEIACQGGTVMEAVQATSNSKDLYVVPLFFQGKSCYRVIYGVYATPAAGESARSSLPQLFLQGSSPAQIIAISKVLK